MEDLYGLSEAAGRHGAGTARERILATAARLFYTRGLRAVGVDTIITESGTAKATFYRHFPAKDDHIVAYLDRADQVWTGKLYAAAETAGPGPGRQLVGIFETLGNVSGHDGFRGCAFINAAAEAGPGTPAYHRAKEHKREVIGWITDLARRAGADRPDRLARTLTFLLDGALSSGSPEDGAGAAAREAARLLVRVSLQLHRSSHVVISPRIRCVGPNQFHHKPG